MPKLGKSNKSEYRGSRIEEYPHPHNQDLLVTIKSMPVGRMNRYGTAMQKGGSQAKTETYKLIVDSVIDADSNEPVFEQSEVASIAEDDCQFISGLIQLIGYHNGGTETDVEELVGNFEQTE